MATINVIGRITQDLELKKGEKTGRTYTNFSLAENEGVGDNQKTTFYECTAFDYVAERIIKAKAKKGSLIHVVGKFSKSDFTRGNGEPGYSLKITVYDWGYIPGTGGQKDSADVGSNGNDGSNGGRTPTPNIEKHHPGSSFCEEIDLDDEDLPF